jgi:DNA polymerase-3 subunit epsilon
MNDDHGSGAAEPARGSALLPEGARGWAVVDVETTGLGRGDRIVSAAVYRLAPDGAVQDHWYTLVNPERDPGPVWIHGLTSDLLEGAPLFGEVAEELAARLDGRVLVAHNALFDWSMISREYARIGGRAPVQHRLCTIVLARDLRLPLRNHKLSALAAHFGVTARRQHHALDDARVLTEVFRPSLRMAEEAGMPLPLQVCVPAVAPEPLPLQRTGSTASAVLRSYRPGRRRPPCPYPNPGRWRPDGPLVQGMRVAISGDTAVDRELLEDRAAEAGLHIASGVSRLTSLLVSNDPGSWTTKARRARELGTPVVGEREFLDLLAAVQPQGTGSRAAP